MPAVTTRTENDKVSIERFHSRLVTCSIHAVNSFVIAIFFTVSFTLL